MARKKKTVTPEEINKETAKAVAEEVVEKVEEVTEEVKDEPAPEVTEEPACAVEEKAEAAEEKAEAAEEKAEAAVEESTPEVETVAEDVEGGSPETSTPTDETIEAEETEVAEDAEGGSPGTSTPTEESEAPAEFMNIEHFADYHSKDEAVAEETEATEEITENAEDGVEATDEVIEEVAEAVEGDKINEEEFHEYENLTILDELEDEESAPLPPAVRKVSKDEEPYNEKKPRRVDERFDIIEMFVCMLVAIMLLSAFVFRHSVVDGDSMMNTLHDDEHLIISNFFYEPKQYDIIVCEDYSTGLKKPIIKRVIATEGQTVRVVSMDEVYVDGVLVDTSFLLIDGKEELIYASQYPIECVVPEGEVFVMGDHRNNSLDSRILGTIDEDTILGKVVLRFYPFDSFGKVE